MATKKTKATEKAAGKKAGKTASKNAKKAAAAARGETPRSTVSLLKKAMGGFKERAKTPKVRGVTGGEWGGEMVGRIELAVEQAGWSRRNRQTLLRELTSALVRAQRYRDFGMDEQAEMLERTVNASLKLLERAQTGQGISPTATRTVVSEALDVMRAANKTIGPGLSLDESRRAFSSLADKLWKATVQHGNPETVVDVHALLTLKGGDWFEWARRRGSAINSRSVIAKGRRLSRLTEWEKAAQVTPELPFVANSPLEKEIIDAMRDEATSAWKMGGRKDRWRAAAQVIVNRLAEEYAKAVGITGDVPDVGKVVGQQKKARERVRTLLGAAPDVASVLDKVSFLTNTFIGPHNRKAIAATALGTLLLGSLYAFYQYKAPQWKAEAAKKAEEEKKALETRMSDLRAEDPQSILLGVLTGRLPASPQTQELAAAALEGSTSPIQLEKERIRSGWDRTAAILQQMREAKGWADRAGRLSENEVPLTPEAMAQLLVGGMQRKNQAAQEALAGLRQ